MKKLILALAGVLIAVVVFWCGYTIGKNRTAKRELNVSIPVHVQVYRRIKNGETNQAATLTSMVLIGKIDRYDSLKDDWLFRATEGRRLFESANLQRYVAEARDIIEAEKSNLITIGPEKGK